MTRNKLKQSVLTSLLLLSNPRARLSLEILPRATISRAILQDKQNWMNSRSVSCRRLVISVYGENENLMTARVYDHASFNFVPICGHSWHIWYTGCFSKRLPDFCYKNYELTYTPPPPTYTHTHGTSLETPWDAAQEAMWGVIGKILAFWRISTNGCFCVVCVESVMCRQIKAEICRQQHMHAPLPANVVSWLNVTERKKKE